MYVEMHAHTTKVSREMRLYKGEERVAEVVLSGQHVAISSEGTLTRVSRYLSPRKKGALSLSLSADSLLSFLFG